LNDVEGANMLGRPREGNGAADGPAAVHLRGRQFDHEVRLAGDFGDHSHVVTE
nr:hypothetical protein [Tanacetum cinerariifolium]